MSTPPPVPYRGIRPFRFADHSIFFAREDESRHLLQLVAVYRGVMLYGQSGVGKSSLINAALLPAAVRLGLQPERVRLQPRAGEEIVIRRIGIGDDESHYLPSPFADASDDAPVVILSCDEFSKRVREIAATRRLLLVVDQFEELVTLFDEADEQRSQREVADMLGSLLRNEVAAKLLFVFREDYLARVKSLLVAAPELIDQALRLRPPRPDALRTIIRGPFEHHRGHFDHELSGDLTEQLQAALFDRFGSGDVSLSEVETLCLRLWRSDEPEELLATHGVQGILEEYLGEELDRLPEDLRYAAGALLSQMVTSAGTRNLISAEDLIARVQKDEQLPRALLEDALERVERKSKLVRRERRRDLYLYEVTSEFLLPWIGRRRAELVRSRERRQFRRRLLISGGIVAALAVVAALATFGLFYALGERSKARHRASEANATAEIARASRLLGSDPADALATALRAATVLRHSTGGPHAQAIGVLSQASLDSHLAATLLAPSSPVVGLGFAQHGSRLVTVLGDGRIDTWSLASENRISLRHGSVARAHGNVTAARLSNDGSLVALDGGRRGWSLWKTSDLAKFGTLPPGKLVFSRDGRLLAVATSGSPPRVSVFAVGQGGLRPRATLRLGRPGGWFISAVSFDSRSRRLVALLQSGQWAIWNLQTRRTVAVTPGLSAAVSRERTSVASVFSRDGRVLAVVTNDVGGVQEHAFLRLYDTRTGRRLASRDIGASVARAAATGSRLILADRLGSVQVWKPQLDAEPIVLSGHLGPVTNAVVSDDGAWIATTGADLTTRIWDGQAGELRATLLGHTNRIKALGFAPNSRVTVTASDDGTVRLWRTLGADDTPLPRHVDVVGHVAFSDRGKTAVTTAVDGTAFLVTAGGTLRQTFTVGRGSFRHNCYALVGTQLHLGDWYAVAACDARAVLNPAGTRLVTGQDDLGGAQLWTPGRATSKQLGPRSAFVESVLFVGPKKGWVAILSSEGANLYDAKTGAPLRPLWSGYARPAPFGAAASASGRYLVVANREPTRRIEVWDVPERRMIDRWPVGEIPKVVAIDPAGAYAAAGITGGEVRIWRVRDGKRLAVLSVGFPVRAIAFSPNGETLATATDANTVDLWDVKTGRKAASLRGHTGGVNSVEFSRNGRFIVTASDDGTVRLWGAEHGETLAVFRQGRTGRATDAAFDPTGTRIVAGASDGSSDIYECRICGGEEALFRFALAQKSQRPIQMVR